MIGNLSGPTLIVIIFIVLLLFGAPKLPALAKSLGQSMKILKKEVTSDDEKTGEPGTPEAGSTGTTGATGSSGTTNATGATGSESPKKPE